MKVHSESAEALERDGLMASEEDFKKATQILEKYDAPVRRRFGKTSVWIRFQCGDIVLSCVQCILFRGNCRVLEVSTGDGEVLDMPEIHKYP